MRRALWTGSAVFAGWTGLALFFAASTSLTYSSMGRPATWWMTLARSLSEWWLWALLTPLVAALARRFPVHNRMAARNLGVHVVAGAALASTKVAADRAVYAGLTGFWTYWLASSFALQFSIYALVVAGAHGLHYYRSGREREQLEARLVETRLELLSLQLQPHFLFNTLNTIAELVHDDPDTADRMIAGLSDLLRRTLELGKVQEIPLRAELDLLALYLDIQRARFGERLRVHIDVTSDAARSRVPVLLLQPLVENAITHGLTSRLSEGQIDVSARCQGDALLIEIADDGTDASGEVGGRERVGLGNTRARLETLYGPAARIELHHQSGGGARVSLTLPIRPAGVTAP